MNRLAFAVLLFLAACNNENKPTTTNEKTGEQIENTKQSTTEKSFGSFEGAAITEYTITNASGMQVGIINYGGTITKIITPDKNKNMGDVVLGYESIDGFVQKGNPYFGALIGRYGNRIGAGKFTLEGKTYTLAGNDHGNSLQ